MGGFFVTFLTRICFFLSYLIARLILVKIWCMWCVCMYVNWYDILVVFRIHGFSIFTNYSRSPNTFSKSNFASFFWQREILFKKFLIHFFRRSFSLLFDFFSLRFVLFFLFLFFAYALSSRLDFFALYVYTLVFTTIWWFCQWFIYYAIVNVD